MRQGGAIARAELERYAKVAKLTTEEQRKLNESFGVTGKAAGSAAIGIKEVGTAATRTATQSLTVTRAFSQMRGGALSLAQGIIGETVPGVTQLTNALGTLAGGAPLVVGIGVGIAAIAGAFKLLTTESRHAKEALDEIRASLLDMTKDTRQQLSFQLETIGVQLADAEERLRRAQQGRLVSRGKVGAVQVVDAAEVQRARDAVADLNSLLIRTTRQLDILDREEKAKRQAAALRDAAEATRKWREEAERLGREWQRFLGTSKTGTLSDLVLTPSEMRNRLRLFNQGVRQVGFTGREQELRERLGRILVPIERATEQTIEAAQDLIIVADSMAAAVGNAFEVWVTGAKSAKEAFRDLIASMLRDLARLAIQRAIIEPLSRFFLRGLVAGESRGLIPLGTTTSGPASASVVPTGAPAVAGIGGVVNMAVNFNVAALDAPGVAALLQQQSGTIATIVGDAARRSTGFRRQLT